MVQKFILSWEDIHNIVIDLNYKTAEEEHGKIGIIGISRGGLVPAVMLSHLKSVEFFGTVGVKSYKDKTKGKEILYQTVEMDKLNKLNTVYLVDDICDSGKTFKFLKDNVFKINNLKTISLIYKKNDVFKPDYYGYEVDSKYWVDFPFEMS